MGLYPLVKYLCEDDCEIGMTVAHFQLSGKQPRSVGVKY